MKRICAATVGVVLLGFCFLQAQGTEPAFAAVSIKPSTLRGPGTVEFKRGGRFVASNAGLLQLVNAAYGTTGRARLIRGPNYPKWADIERFDVEAVAEDGAIPGNLDYAQLRAKMESMLQRMLADRFMLVVRRVSKEMSVYALSTAPAGAKLTAAPMSDTECRTSSDCHQLLGNRISGLRGTAVNMADLVYALETGSDRPIVDETGIIGLFSVQIRPFAALQPLPVDFLADIPEDRRPPPEPYKPSLASILEKDFGLVLRPAHSSIEVIQVESAERPSAN